MNSVILKGVVIGEESVIGANTVIRSSVASKSICIGNPAIVTGKVRE
jgi:acetyltransferase-like isoleucine patch superfamily enzyme